ncbi:cytochrome b-c1 complex subunit 7-like [Chrysoperla carnea]|uniref:cytochrome b-c1 complex subunit 7-like n=1 Tax=Chrysoperla carnea TaxID=189513 RepID=UPI001D07CD53|nr:cytochrome b-c1 complex subunit 7-like [Chrysoperla carnea]
MNKVRQIFFPILEKVFSLEPRICHIQPRFEQAATMKFRDENKCLEGPPSTLKKIAYNISGFREYGLMRDDLLPDDISYDVAEALKRLPADLYDERSFRIVRAAQLSMNNEVLPKYLWTQLEDDVLYLKPLVEEVRREREEHEHWDNFC